MSVETIALKLPTFWDSSPEAWFAQAEAQFNIRGITKDETKYFHVLAALDNSTATRAVSLITCPPSEDKFPAIKAFLCSAFGLSDTERASALLTLQGLGDRKPSEVMDTMLALLGEHAPCFIFKEIFMRQLPAHVRAPLANSPLTDYRLLAQEADKIYLSSKQNVDFSNDFPTNSPAIDHVCWYHRKFGNKSTKCEPSCKEYRKFKSNSKNQGNGGAGRQ